MPISSSAAALEKKKSFRLRGSTSSICAEPTQNHVEKKFLTIEPALPRHSHKLYKRSHSTLNANALQDFSSVYSSEAVILQAASNGTVHLSRIPQEKEKHPDRISLDRRGLTALPTIDGEPKLRLLSLQHNLINNLDGLKHQHFPYLVFLDIYDNQLDKINSLDSLENLRVLLMGKNRIKKIEGLEQLTKIEVLDLHGNQIVNVTGLGTLSELKVLNLAGNQIRIIGIMDLQGLIALQELNLRRNRLKKLLGFGATVGLIKLFLSNNEISSVEDMCSIAKSANIREIAVDNNPISVGGDAVSFLVSYLPQLTLLNGMQITEQARKAAMAWRRNKETSNVAFMDLTSDVCLNVRREEVISNARTNWELLRTQTKCLSSNTAGTSLKNVTKHLKPDNDFILTALTKPPPKNDGHNSKYVDKNRMPLLPDKKSAITRTSSQETENSQNTSSSNTTSGNEFFRLPPILVPIINKMEQTDAPNISNLKECPAVKLSGSLTSLGPNVDSSVSSLLSNTDSESSQEDGENSEDENAIPAPAEMLTTTEEQSVIVSSKPSSDDTSKIVENKSKASPKSVVASTNISLSASTASNSSGNEPVSGKFRPFKTTRNIKSAANWRSTQSKIKSRASTAKPKKLSSPKEAVPEREREQGGDYLIEICGRHLNIYGQGALRFVDKSWSMSKAKDVTTINFNYANFNSITGVLNKLKQRFPNAENFVFKETNISCLGQLNALAEIQGLCTLAIDEEGNPIVHKKWQSYAVYRLAHWGLKFINGKEITENDIKLANEEYQSLSDLVLWSLPDILLQPLLQRLRLDINQAVTEQTPKKWLITADPALQSVVSKEALQWKKGPLSQDDILFRQKAKLHIGAILGDTCNAVNKLRHLDKEWPQLLQELVRNILIDYSQIDLYMKKKIQELK